MTSAIVAGAAAADLTAYKAPPPVYNWAGFYLGGHIGGAWGNVTVRDDINPADGVPAGPFPFTASGIFGGGTAGYNVQRGNLVFGVEADLGYLNLTGSGIIPSSNPAAHQNLTLSGGGYGDATGRLGLVVDRALFYAKGGFAFFDGQGEQATTNPGYLPQAAHNFTGWTAGGGIEYLFSPGWSAKAEYQYFNFGTQTGFQANIGDLTSTLGYRFFNTFQLTANTAKLGVTYHFGQ
ncbi:MAG: outer membrane protein [Xanthobacteraceae bacterium]